MVDAVQRGSTIPLPDFQTEAGAHNPLPLNAPKETNRLDDVAKTRSAETQKDGFESYLNQGSVTTVPRTEDRPTVFDPAAEIAAASVYGQPNGGRPL